LRHIIIITKFAEKISFFSAFMFLRSPLLLELMDKNVTLMGKNVTF